ncbi:MAG: hypothetical protein ACO2OZ_08025 [Acidilobaceae archaeon]
MSEDVIKALLSSARELYERALREFEEAVARNDVIGILLRKRGMPWFRLLTLL